MEKFEITFQEWIEINTKLYKDCTEYLYATLDKVYDNHIDLAEECPCSCSYDGGEDPASANLHSSVCSVYKKNGKVYLDTEDANHYSIKRLNVEELVDVTSGVKYSYEHYYLSLK